MTTTTTTTGAPAVATEGTRWGQLIACIICMVLIANLQYGWTLFVNPINKAHGWSLASIQFAFSIFIALETWLTPIEGWIVDTLGARRGPKLVVAFGGIMVALGWVINAYAQSLEMLYLGAVVGGIGGGAVYATCVGQAVKWFPDRRGLAVGLTAAGYGAGSALTVIPIRDGDRHRPATKRPSSGSAWSRAASSSFWPGCCAGPSRARLAGAAGAEGRTDVAQLHARGGADARRCSGCSTSCSSWCRRAGLMATAQIAPIAKDFNVGDAVILFGASTLSVALIVDNICNGGARPLFGWISDQIGREYTMAIAFGLGGVAYWLLGALGHAPWAFVVFAALIFLTWGEIFSLFPSTCTDTFGTKFATVNLSLLYTAKGTSAFLVPVANLIKIVDRQLAHGVRRSPRS